MRTEDGYVISRCLTGESETFGLLVDKYKAAIYAFAFARLGDFQDAEDVTQEVFLRAYEKLRTLKRWDSFLAWLYAIASNQCKKQLQARERQLDRQYIEDQDESVLDRPSVDAYRRKREYEPLYEALAELPDIYREVVTLYYLGGMSRQEIAQFLGTSPETIKSRLRGARAQLKQEMITMMTTTFDEMKLQPSFTFHIVETLKRTKIQTPASKATLPVGVSAAAGLIVLMLSLAVPHSPLYPIGEWIGSALPSKTQIPEVGVIPVDTIEITDITILSSEQGKSDFGQKPKPDSVPVFGGGEWTERANMPQERATVSVSEVDNKIYVIGGVNRIGGVNKNLSTTEMYNPETDEWQKRADMPTARAAAATCTVNGKIYVIGGGDKDNNPLATTEMYDPVANKWFKKANMLTARFGPVATVVDGKIYVIGGTLHELNGIDLPTVEEYDPETNIWVKKKDMPTARYAAAVGVVEEKIHVIAGLRAGLPAAKTVEMYDPAIDVWMQKADIPTGRGAAGSRVVDGKIYVVAGLLRNPGNFAQQTEVYDPENDLWAECPDLPQLRAAVGLGMVNGKLYVFGGWAGEIINGVPRFC